MLKNSLEAKLDNLREVSTDSTSSYREFCIKYNLTINAISLGFYINGIFNMSEIIEYIFNSNFELVNLEIYQQDICKNI